MKFKTTPEKPATELLQIIEEARKAESRQDVNALQEILRDVWDDVEVSPDYANYDIPLRAELLRLSGTFLTLYASSKNLKDYHLRAKDLLTASISLFQWLNLPEKEAVANLWLGYAYGNCGETDNYEAVYKILEEQFFDRKNHPIYLLIVINRLAIYIYQNENELGLKYYIDNYWIFKESSDRRLKAFYHQNAGIIHRNLGFYNESLKHYWSALENSAGLGMLRFEARNHNNLGWLLKDFTSVAEAHLAVDKAIEIANELEDFGLLAGSLDSKAVFYIDEAKYAEALEAIERSLDYFYQGEDVYGLCEALWTKCLALLRLGRRAECFIIYAELQKTALEKIGEAAAQKFETFFDDEFYVLQGLALKAELAALEKHLTGKALLETNGDLGKAAKLLGLKYQNVQYSLERKFPTLRSELEITKRKSPEKTHSRRNSNSPVFVDKKDGEIFIAPADLPNKVYSYLNFSEAPRNIETFYCNDAQMRIFGINEDAVIAVSPVDEITAGMIVLVKMEARFVIGFVRYESLFDIYFIDGCAEPVPVDLENLSGKIEGYCPFSKIQNSLIEFVKLEI